LPGWLVHHQTLLEAIGVLRWHARINCSLAALLPGSRWAVLHVEPEHALEFATALDSAAYYAHGGENVRAVVATKRTLLSNRGHFHDLTVPVLRGRRLESVICAGAFLTRPLTRDALVEQWQLMGGSSPSSYDPFFRKFVRSALRLPVLEPADLRAFRELLQIVADLLVGAGDASRHARRIDALRANVFSLWLPALERMAGRFVDPVHNRAWSDGLLFSHDKEELGMQNMPNIVVAVTRTQGGRGTDPVVELALGRELQRKAVRFARTLPETLAAPLDDHGVLFLSHVPGHRSRASRRARIGSLVEKMSAFVRRETNARAIAGVGRQDGLGRDLPETAREALLAMQLAAHRQLPVLFHDDLEGSEHTERAAHGSSRVARIFEEERFAELGAALSDWIKTVLEESAEQPGVVRAHVEGLLAVLTDIAARRAGLEARASADLRRQTDETLGSAVSVVTLLDALRGGVALLVRVVQAPPVGRMELKLDRAARYIAEACTEPLRLGQVAQRVGISRNYFGELFKKTYGKGFGEVLFEHRLTKAKTLLRNTDHPVNAIALESGFGNVASFHRAFRQAVGTTPSAFRQRGKEWASPG
jgi:AraC-like DNA-binding protein